MPKKQPMFAVARLRTDSTIPLVSATFVFSCKPMTEKFIFAPFRCKQKLLVESATKKCDVVDSCAASVGLREG
ncbi:MAG: hypothetical protein LH472_05675 [Pyrinomonadaceae bacterium]|nr:hypothetical protein [Pyrinomonadaceae bacterium]